MNNASTFREELVKNIFYRLDENLRMIRIALAQITEEEIWLKPNTTLNSIGNLILHLCGNLTQYGISSLSGATDDRVRDLEFSTESGFLKQELLDKLETTVNQVKATIIQVSDEHLIQIKEVQGYQFSGIGNAIHLVEHFSYHTGQIAFWVKLLKSNDLGFYSNVDLNKRNKKE